MADLHRFYCNLTNRTRQLFALLFCVFAVVRLLVFCDFLTVAWVGLWSMIVACSGHTHLFFDEVNIFIMKYRKILIKYNAYLKISCISQP